MGWFDPKVPHEPTAAERGTVLVTSRTCDACFRADTVTRTVNAQGETLTLCVDPFDCRNHWPMNEMMIMGETL